MCDGTGICAHESCQRGTIGRCDATGIWNQGRAPSRIELPCLEALQHLLLHFRRLMRQRRNDDLRGIARHGRRALDHAIDELQGIFTWLFTADESTGRMAFKRRERLELSGLFELLHHAERESDGRWNAAREQRHVTLGVGFISSMVGASAS